MRNILLLLIIFLFSSCHYKNCRLIRYDNVSKELDTIYVVNYVDYDYNEYQKTVTFKDYWHHSFATYNNVKEIKKWNIN